VIQPADLFLDLIGEELRARTYVFTDPDGAELCLRPDLTIPACQIYRARHGAAGTPARFAYNGVVFRYQSTAEDMARPREFRQAGIESFASAEPARAEAEVVALSVESVRAAGLRALRLRMGDIGLFHGLLSAIDMPERWRRRLMHHFWRPEAFRRHLSSLTRPGESLQGPAKALIYRLDRTEPEAAVALLAEHLGRHDIEISGTRTLGEIAEQLAAAAEDMRAAPLRVEVAELLEAYLAIEVPVREATERIRKLVAGHGLDLEPVLSQFDARLGLIAAEGVDVTPAEFTAGFGRAFEYYSGFVFEMVSPTLGPARPVGGGGRYDTLLQAMGMARPVPAVGVALHTDRLLLAVRGGRP
jgi:ATP phosphoribosyltransferase regulatory subunit